MWRSAGVQPLEACFAVDSDRRVTQWGHAAAVALGIDAELARGRRCFEVIGGRELFRRTDCRVGCAAFAALRGGQVTATHRLTIEAGETSRRFVCKPLALPDPPGGAVITLVPQGRLNGRSTTALDTLHDLAALGALATSLRPAAAEVSIERTLDWLRATTGAEVAELFIAEPRGRDMLLSSFRGPFRSAFFQICRFQPGQGFPGLVETSGKPIATHDLASEPRYLRSRVKDRGFQSYVCVPVRSSGGVIGSLDVAARHPDFDLDRAQHLLAWASALLGTLIQASSYEPELLEPAPARRSQTEADAPDDLLRTSLRRLASVGKASDGRLFLYNSRRDGVVRQVTIGSPDALVCASTCASRMHTCPTLVGGHGTVLQGPRRLWPEACRRLSAKGGVIHCLPLIAGELGLGVAQLRYAPGRLSPPTAHLADLLCLAQQAAWTIRPVFSVEESRLDVPVSPDVPQQRHDYPLAANERMPGRESSRTFLDIRCLGSFRLLRQGALITPDMVSRRGALAVFKILLMHRGRRVSRDLLAELLWPEVEPSAGANRLHLLVHALRQLVEPEPQDRRWTYVRNDGDCYYFHDGAPYRLDVDDFLSSFELGRRREREGDAVGATAAYEAAAALYRGDFLEDEPYAEWAWEERERLREIYLTLLARLGAMHAQRDNLERSIEWYRRSLRVDPLREEHHRALMRVLSLAGRRDEALRQYHTCRTILHDELDVAPLPETEALFASLKSSQPTPA